MVLDLLTDLYWMYYKWIASRFIAHAGREREREERKKKRSGGTVAELTDSNSSRLMSALLNLFPLPIFLILSFVYVLLPSFDPVVFIILIRISSVPFSSGLQVTEDSQVGNELFQRSSPYIS